MKNALKSLSFLLVMGALLFVVSCGSDDGGGAVDSNDPTITLNAPADGAIVAAGSQVATSISIEDDIEISTVTITVGNGTVIVFENEDTDVASTSYSFSQNISIPANVVLGEHTVEVSVTDASGNVASATATITALPVYTDGKTTVMVETVPSQVTDYTGENIIHMVGSHQGDETGAGAWDPESGTHPLSSHVDSEGTETFYVQVDNTGVEGFKMVRGTTLGWNAGEKGAEGEEIDNRTIEAEATHVTLDEIKTWKDYNPDVQDNSTVDVISGTGVTSIEIKGKVVVAASTQSAISTTTYSILDDGETEVASGSLTLDGEGNYSESVSIESLELGSYEVFVYAVDADGNNGRGDATLNIVEFPCDGSGLDAVSASMTRVMISVNTNLGTRDMYATGKINGADVWGTISPEYKMTKISDGCYYIDLTLQANDQLQFFYEEETYGADWWKGAATRVAGDGGTAAVNISANSSGDEVKAVFEHWREDPPSS
ncbi:DUF4625 domain-containing protein [Ekhidna sp.]|uniref:DUF4625 domain-containing protein n=1 Tax=Ekhidna sp. TaxID=2608089 RepID=UPI003517580A